MAAISKKTPKLKQGSVVGYLVSVCCNCGESYRLSDTIECKKCGTPVSPGDKRDQPIPSPITIDSSKPFSDNPWPDIEVETIPCTGLMKDIIHFAQLLDERSKGLVYAHVVRVPYDRPYRIEPDNWTYPRYEFLIRAALHRKHSAALFQFGITNKDVVHVYERIDTVYGREPKPNRFTSQQELWDFLVEITKADRTKSEIQRLQELSLERQKA